MARDCKGKRYPNKQVNATIARAVCATDRKELNEDELERLGIHRQLGLSESDIEYLDEALERRSPRKTKPHPWRGRSGKERRRGYVIPCPSFHVR
jgi:hypothetical protein